MAWLHLLQRLVQGPHLHFAISPTDSSIECPLDIARVWTRVAVVPRRASCLPARSAACMVAKLRLSHAQIRGEFDRKPHGCYLPSPPRCLRINAETREWFWRPNAGLAWPSSSASKGNEDHSRATLLLPLLPQFPLA